jgi:hypothetical protein
MGSAFVASLDDPTSRMARMTPASMEAGDLSFAVDYGNARPPTIGDTVLCAPSTSPPGTRVRMTGSMVGR